MTLVDALAQETKKKEKPKSKQSRFPLIEVVSMSRDQANSPLVPAHSYRFKSTVTAKLPRLLVHGAGSAAMAAVESGWYLKTGCCADIQQSGSNTRMFFYIPHVGPLSMKKKILYIKELEELFPRRIRYVGVQIGPIVTHPITNVESRIGLNDGSHGVSSTPKTFIAAEKYLIVYCKVMCNRDRLLFLQFLRPLYQTIHTPAFSHDYSYSPYSQFNVEYYQPRLYFRLKRWFPKLNIIQLMYLSFTMHGEVVSSTYFPHYYYGNSYNDAFDIRNYNSITGLVSPLNNSYHVAIHPAPLEEIRDGNFDPHKVEISRSNHLTIRSTSLKLLLKYLFLQDTKESYTKAIILISRAINKPDLIKNL